MKLENFGTIAFLGVIAVILLIFCWKLAVAIFLILGWIYVRLIISNNLGAAFWEAKRKRYEGCARKKEDLEESADMLAFLISTFIFGAIAVWIFIL